MRKSVAVVMTAALLAALAGCSSSQTPSSDCTPQASSGDASNVVDVTGDFGTTPQVTIPTPLIADATERTVAIHGGGRIVRPGDVAVIQYTFVDGNTGQAFPSAATGASPVNVNSALPDGMRLALTCASTGDRIVAVFPKSEVTTADSTTDDIVVVIDVVDSYPGRATSPARAAPNGFPNVVYGEDDRPGLEVTGGVPPAGLKTAVLREGDGPTVEVGDIAVVQATIVVWQTKTTFTNSWASATPMTVGADPTRTLADGFFPGLVGQKVGSQFIAVVPPEMGLGTAGSQAGVDPVPPNATLLLVVDVLAIVAG